MRGRRGWGEGSLLAMRPVHAGEGERGEREVCWRGDLSMRGGRVRGERSLLAKRPVHAGESVRGERVET